MTATSLHLLILLVLVHFFFLFSQLDDIIHLFTTLNTSWRSDFFFLFFYFPLLESTNFICDQANVQGQQVYIRFVISEHFEIKAV